MAKKRRFNVLVEKAKDNYTAKCVEVGVVSQGKTIGQALDAITEALDLYLENAKPKIKEVFVAQVEV